MFSMVLFLITSIASSNALASAGADDVRSRAGQWDRETASAAGITAILVSLVKTVTEPFPVCRAVVAMAVAMAITGVGATGCAAPTCAGIGAAGSSPADIAAATAVSSPADIAAATAVSSPADIAAAAAVRGSAGIAAAVRGPADIVTATAVCGPTYAAVAAIAVTITVAPADTFAAPTPQNIVSTSISITSTHN